ncbi:hypothetical protein, partial [Escherichia coli]|uniref:hypothetical protein n=1 Tax=Escherichia coli TaxID=562 RepID=UPI001BDB8F31
VYCSRLFHFGKLFSAGCKQENNTAKKYIFWKDIFIYNFARLLLFSFRHCHGGTVFVCPQTPFHCSG